MKTMLPLAACRKIAENLLSLIWLAAMAGAAQVPQSDSRVTLSTLDSVIPHVSLTAGVVEVFGGATIEDAVMLLRSLVVFPVCIEKLDFDGEADGLTLGEVLGKLRNLKTQHGLAPQDEARLQIYQQWSATKGASTVIGLKKKTFTLVEDNITVRTFLDRITEMDSAYVWRDDGSGTVPLIVIQPQKRSVLEWSVPRTCGSAEELSSAKLYAPGGTMTVLLQAHNISRIAINGRNKLPDVPLDLCRNDLTARDVLNLTIEAAGHDVFWSVSGIRGLRWLTFQ